MPAIQDTYSVDVSNRYELNNSSDRDEESDTAPDYDPFDTLKSLEDQKRRAQDEEKLKKQARAAVKAKNQKKATRFKEIKDSNVPTKQEDASNTTKTQRHRDEHSEGSKLNNRRGGDSQAYPEGDENRRPPRRRNDPPKRSGEGDQIKPTGKEEQVGNYGRPGNERSNRSERFRGGRGGPRNGGGGGYRGRSYGGYRNDGRDDRGKREFDRRSGSDRSSVRPSDKRDGAGPRNWGTPGKELEEPTEVPTTGEDAGPWPEQQEAEGKETPKKEKSDVEEGEEKEVKEESSEMTLDEWKAKQASQAKIQAFNIRKAGEGENTEQWKNMKLLRKNAKDTDQAGMANKEQHKRQMKPHVNVNIQFGDNAPRGFGRGYPRGERGGRGRGQRGQRFGPDRSQRGYQMLPDVQNEQEFPTLG